MITIYAEKPNMAKTIAEAIDLKAKKNSHYYEANFNGNNYFITWGFGHMFGLCDVKDYTDNSKWNYDNYPFIPQKFNTKIKSSQDKKSSDGIKEQYKAVKELFSKSDYLICATDADREGELIFAYVYENTKCGKPWKRLWLNSTEKKSICSAMNNLKTSSEMKSTQDAARCRSQSDWLIGINSTVYSTLKFGGYNNVMSVGRVQTPTLALLVNKELEIKNFVSKPFWTIKNKFEANSVIYSGDLKEPEKIFDKSEAQKIYNDVKSGLGIISKCETKPEIKKPPLLFDLNSLQMQANSDFGFSAQKTLDIAQQLYEQQYLTYPRTTSKYLPTDLKDTVLNVLDSFIGTKYEQISKKTIPLRDKVLKPYFDNSKVESHYAIIPTSKNAESLSGDNEKIYSLVAKSILKIFLPDSISDKTNIITKVKEYEFISKGSIIRQLGWLEVDGQKKDDTILPPLSVGQSVKIEKSEIVEGKTEPPKRYTDKTLLGIMETAGKLVEDEELRLLMKSSGIGTPATRAGIIEKLIYTNYVTREKKSLVPTEKGIYLITNLPCEELKSPEMTGKWEKRMNDIELGKDNIDSFMNDIEIQTKNICEQIKLNESKGFVQETYGKCPLCGGNISKKTWGFGCDNYKTKECKFSISGTIKGKKLSDTNIKQLLQKGITTKINGFTSTSGKSFSAKLKLENGKISFVFDD